MKFGLCQIFLKIRIIPEPQQDKMTSESNPENFM